MLPALLELGRASEQQKKIKSHIIVSVGREESKVLKEKSEAPVWIKVIRTGLKFDGNLTVKELQLKQAWGSRGREQIERKGGICVYVCVSVCVSVWWGSIHRKPGSSGNKSAQQNGDVQGPHCDLSFEQISSLILLQTIYGEFLDRSRDGRGSLNLFMAVKSKQSFFCNW